MYFLDRMQRLENELHSVKKAKNADRIYLPGEMEWDKRNKAEQNGEIEITDAMSESYKKLADLTKISFFKNKYATLDHFK